MLELIDYDFGGKMMIANPTFFENEGGRQNGYDLFSRLLKDRIILLFNEISDDLACSIVAQLLFLEAQDPEKDITLAVQFLKEKMAKFNLN